MESKARTFSLVHLLLLQLRYFFVVSSSKLCGVGQASYFLSVQVPSMLGELLEKIICVQERCQQDWQHEGG